jgi:Putative DNA-binding domain
LFNKVLSDVTYADVLAFCQTYPEGVRAEYKREAVHIAKVVSSFANTFGGIWVIGVDTDKANRAILPPIGLPLTPGIEEKIVQSAQAGVYPPITPAVRVFDIPDKAGHVLVIVKVPESVDAPHAVENSTRVHIRVENTTESIELSDIDRIAYLLKRRRAPEEWREALIEQASAMSVFSQEGKRETGRMRVIIAPMYPCGALFSYDELYQRARGLDDRGHRLLRNFRLVHEAIMAGQVTDSSSRHHLELSTNGILFFEEPMEAAGQLEGIPYFHPINLLYPMVRALDTADHFFSGALTNLLIRCELIECVGVGYFHDDPRRLAPSQRTLTQGQCLDRVVRVSAYSTAESLAIRRVEILTDLLRPILWAFSYRAEAGLRADVEQMIRGIR